jgi:hypothetical protein
MDFLRACQREGVLRLERDRRGALRVFPGSRTSAPAGETMPKVVDGEVEEPIAAVAGPGEDIDDSQAVQGFSGDAEEESSAHITDSTAEMLARAAAGETPARRRKPAGIPKGRRPAGRTPSARNGRLKSRRSPSD